ncbi:MAG: efflux RND transporter periplasmic adaptor subunit [Candidatus Eremiobacteraeota bacterium]|nr:efflux RND transporter periplasmic adaptor subunit [Candidatus Eremiobacteraeota bacterium]
MKRLTFLCALAALAGCSQPQPKAAPPSVATSPATVRSIQPHQRLAGIVAPYENVAIQSTLVEPADSVNVQEGEAVHAGEVLATLDTADLQAQLAADNATANSNQANTAHAVYAGSLSIAQGVDAVQSAQAGLNQANANLTRDRAQLQRDQNLFSQGYVAQATVQQDQATVRGDESALNTAQSNLSAAKSTVAANGSLSSGGLQKSAVQQSQAQEQVAAAQADQVRVQIDKARLVSPIDGVIVNRNLNPGEYPGTRQLFTIQQVDPVYAVLHGSGAQVAQIQTGAPARITAADLGPRAAYTGRVVGVLNQINPGSTDFQVKVVLANPQRKLRPGMAVLGDVPLPSVRGVTVPQTAFIDDNDNSVMTVGDGNVIKTVHVTEVASDGTTAVVAGLPAGTRVVNNGQIAVGDGEQVVPQ